MKEHFFNVFLPCLLLILFLIIGSRLFLETPSYEAGAAPVSVFPSSITAYVGQNVSIDVNVTGVSDLYGWEFKLNWTANILNSVNVTEGPFLKSDGNSTFFYYYLNATAGEMTVDCTRLGNILGVSGSGVLASVKFNIKSSGHSPLNLYYAILVNSQEHKITSQLNSGNVYSSSAPDSAEFSTFLVIPLFMIATLMTAFAFKRKRVSMS